MIELCFPLDLRESAPRGPSPRQIASSTPWRAPRPAAIGAIRSAGDGGAREGDSRPPERCAYWAGDSFVSGEIRLESDGRADV